MNNEKDNVYDLVEDFYAHDEGWNTLLRQEYAEGFLRMEAWKGKKNSDLYRSWDNLTMLCLYLGSAETFLGDMNADDFIDCIAWCGRNISEFTPDYKNTQDFLETCDGLFKYLKGKNAISNDTVPATAAEILLQEGKMNIILPDGSFDEANAERAWNATPDIPAKIFLNIGERLQELLEVLHRFFEREYFRLDLDRAAFLYYGILMGYEDEKKDSIEETSECFWDYFLFDYHLLRSDKRPLEFFYERTCLPESDDYDEEFAKRNRDVLEELCKARLAIFKIDSYTDDGAFYCTDWLSGEKYTLSLPLEESEDFYESIVRHRNVKGAYINDQDVTYDPLPERIEHDNFSELMHDFIAPIGNANNLSFQEFVAVIKLASLGWNIAQIGKDALQTELAQLELDALDIVEFFRQRKNKYFKENKTLIQSAEAHDGNEGFELRLVVGNMEDLTIEQTAD